MKAAHVKFFPYFLLGFSPFRRWGRWLFQEFLLELLLLFMELLRLRRLNGLQ
ncbi:hypothetical protein CFBP498_15330 [Xanthomonas hortorum pv. vitians]|uniref:Uncharacterized protein n=1 Tax=Xanthomonas hortorum pv. vitians TaxID=83224 RepID=A0A6V7CPV6_9XANT|nr:hypothetical protein CFBP498_15330 [Xanthomonas hortorum pv. vitians]CAD0319772.1 hypothetical protein CFBP498_15330 [Xanthomonas hortorum pv. vitians]